MDITALIRQVLRQRELAEQQPYRLELPSSRGWPGDDAWSAAGLPVARDDTSLIVGPSEAWQPTFDVSGHLGHVDLATSAPFGMVHDGTRVRSESRAFEEEPLDPFLQGIDGLDYYRGSAQREAVRAAVRCPAGGVLHVLLPTGTGKSLVGLARGLADRHGTTVVIVPTVALALDQERKARTSALARVRRLPRHLAYYGGLSEEGKREVLDQLRGGTQGVLFVSPEAVVQGRLSDALHELAANGGLSALVIDEAHLVATWGGSFRPAFQLLPALRNGLLAQAASRGHAGFATITMTGTLSSYGLELLLSLFPTDDVAVVGSAWIRSEPRYLAARFDRSPERDAALIAALPYLPRPMIVYVSRPDRAVELAQLIRGAGYERVASFHGDTQDQERRRVLEGWGGQEAQPSLDVVVATSAFGLGVDVPDVRSVVHACLPETFDRYYQEVGRGGRDWHASISLLMTSPRDTDESAGLRRELVIGQEKGWPRWQRLTEAIEYVEGDWWRVPIDRRPDGRPGTDFDVRWNLHLVNLMRHAGIIELRTTRVSPAPVEARDGGAECVDPRRVGLVARFREITPASAEEWYARTDSHRVGVYAAVDESGELVAELLERVRHTSDVARDAYEIRRSADPTVFIQPVGSCGGCPFCEQPPRDRVVRSGTHVPACDAFAMGQHLALGTGNACRLTVIDDEDDRARFVARLVEKGVPRVAGVLSPPHPRFWEHALRRSPVGWVLHDRDPAEFSPLPSVVLLGADVPAELLWAAGWGPRVLVLRSDSTRSGDRRPLHELHGTVDPITISGER